MGISSIPKRHLVDLARESADVSRDAHQKAKEAVTGLKAVWTRQDDLERRLDTLEKGLNALHQKTWRDRLRLIWKIWRLPFKAPATVVMAPDGPRG